MSGALLGTERLEVLALHLIFFLFPSVSSICKSIGWYCAKRKARVGRAGSRNDLQGRAR